MIIHKGAFIRQIIEILKKKPGKKVFVDCTCGTGSHTLAILENFSEEVEKIFCIDIDCEILDVAKMRINSYLQEIREQKEKNPSLIFINDNYKNLKNIVDCKADVIILDSGVSLYHLKKRERGFGFDSPFVDMRYDRNMPFTALDVIRKSSNEELERILINYAGIKKPQKIVKILKEYIEQEHIKVPLGHYLQQHLKKVRARLHPATLIFQALRIYVNKELDNLELFLRTVPDVLNQLGMLFVITYHSLEDKIVKSYFRNYSKLGEFSLFNRKVIKPTYREILENKCIRSAKLRILYRNENLQEEIYNRTVSPCDCRAGK
ncbi:MAG: 16S rRNA (cytosine(1402)-N(4))-methyltransferase RsmH [Planctomycetota bacterium]